MSKGGRLLLADPQTLVMEGVAALLRGDFEIAGMVTDGRRLLAEAERLEPDVVLLETALPPDGGLAAARLVHERCPRVRLLFVTADADRRMVHDAMAMGAAGYVLKSSTAVELQRAVADAVRGQAASSRLTALDGAGDGGRRGLTARQREVLQLLVEGRSMKEVAGLLKVTPRTVAFHKYKAMEQLRVRTTAELVKFAVKNGVVGH